VIRSAAVSRWTRAALVVAVLSVAHLWPFGTLLLTPTISLVELEWTVSALAGSIYSLGFVLEVVRDAAAVRPDDEGHQLVLDVLLLVGTLLLGLHLLLLGFGALAMASPNARSSTTLLARLVGVGFTVVGQELVLALVVIRVKRARMRAIAAAA